MENEKRTDPMSRPVFIGDYDATDRNPRKNRWTRIQD